MQIIFICYYVIGSFWLYEQSILKYYLQDVY